MYKIIRLSDSHDCETCGSTWAEGYRVYQDEVLVSDRTPVAHCYGGTDFSQCDPYVDILLLEHISFIDTYEKE